MKSVVALVHAYHLDGVDLDDEPPGFFDKQAGEGLLERVKALRAKLGPQAFISVELARDGGGRAAQAQCDLAGVTTLLQVRLDDRPLFKTQMTVCFSKCNIVSDPMLHLEVERAQ